MEGTKDLLQTLGQLGYRASMKKAQICKEEVVYLGYKLRGGQRLLTQAMKQMILGIPTPTNKRGVREFLELVAYCHLRIPGFAEIARPLYEGAAEKGEWGWTEAMDLAFHQLKEALLLALALILPVPTKPFQMFIDKKKGIAKGVLTQVLGPWKRPVAYISKKN